MSRDPRIVTRPEGEEEVTPPYVAKVRSFDSLSVAQVLQSKMAQEEVAGPTSPRSPRSPGARSVAEAAEGLLHVQQQQSTENAVDCLMSLSVLASQQTAEPEQQQQQQEEEEQQQASKKRPSQEQLHAARRRLKMRAGNLPSPLTVRPRPAPPKLHPISGASVQQIRWLAAAFKMCPEPTKEQCDAISERIQIPSESISAWFASRKVLQDWIAAQPNLSRDDLQSMFYTPSQPSPSPMPQQATLA